MPRSLVACKGAFTAEDAENAEQKPGARHGCARACLFASLSTTSSTSHLRVPTSLAAPRSAYTSLFLRDPAFLSFPR